MELSFNLLMYKHIYLDVTPLTGECSRHPGAVGWVLIFVSQLVDNKRVQLKWLVTRWQCIQSPHSLMMCHSAMCHTMLCGMTCGPQRHV